MEATDTLLVRGPSESGDSGAAHPDDSAKAPPQDKNADHTPSASADSDDFAHAGEMLKAAREAMDISIETVSERINVKPERLAMIEALDKSGLPAPTFTLGFVRSYARTLGLPEDALVERFRRDAGYPAPRQAPVLEPKMQDDLSIVPKINLLTVFGLVIAILWLTWKVLEASAPQQVVAETTAAERMPLIQRERSSTGVTYTVETSLEDQTVLDDTAALPETTETVASMITEVSGEVVVPVSPEGLERALEAGEEEARMASLAVVQEALDEAASTTDEQIVSEAAAAEAAGEEAALTEETTEAAELAESQNEATDTAPSAEDLNAATLNELVRAAVQRSDEMNEVETATSTAAIVSDEGVSDEGIETVTEDGIEIVEANETEAVQTVVAVAVEDGRAPATVRAAIEPIYPSRCESAAAETETVTVRYTVSRYGKVVNPEAIASTNDCFDRAAVAAVSRWDFFPAEENGTSVSESNRTSRIVFQRP